MHACATTLRPTAIASATAAAPALSQVLASNLLIRSAGAVHFMSRSAAVVAFARLCAQAETSSELARRLFTLAGQHRLLGAHVTCQGSAAARAAAWTSNVQQALGAGASPARLALVRQFSTASEGGSCPYQRMILALVGPVAAAAAAAAFRLHCHEQSCLPSFLPVPDNFAEAAAREAVEDTLRPRILRYFAFFMICSAGLNVLPYVAAASVRRRLAPRLFPWAPISSQLWGRLRMGRPATCMRRSWGLPCCAVSCGPTCHAWSPCRRWATAWPCWMPSSPSWSRPAAPGCSCCCGWRRRGSGLRAKAQRRACWRCCAGGSCWRRMRVRRLGGSMRELGAGRACQEG